MNYVFKLNMFHVRFRIFRTGLSARGVKMRVRMRGGISEKGEGRIAIRHAN